MTISMHTMSVDSFVPMLESLAEVLDKGAAHASRHDMDLVRARLAPDMYDLAKQVQMACHYATDATARLQGKPARQPATDNGDKSVADLKQRISTAIQELKETNPASLANSEGRNCNIPLPNGMMIEMDGLRLLRSWSLPHFYFHVVTAYDILRHNGVSIGKQDYLSQVGQFIRPQGPGTTNDRAKDAAAGRPQ